MPRSIFLLLAALFIAQSEARLFEFNKRIECFSCSSISPTQIVGGAGVHPGIYLTSIPLQSIPITARCLDPFNARDAVRAGASSPTCEEGLCVKINYTDKLTVAELRCYSCTTMDASQLLNDVQDQNWRRWLENVRFVPKTPRCNDMFLTELALRSGVQSTSCDNGVCMKMWFKERSGAAQVWRSCIPNARNQIRSDCTSISSSEGDMEVCTCTDNLCNGKSTLKSSKLIIITSIITVIFAIIMRY